MASFSRAFIRIRMMSLAATASVSATSFALAQDSPKTLHVGAATPIQYVADWSVSSKEQPFLLDNRVAMNKMMADMAIKPSGDVDRDFVAMMVPHHQGAVDMANAELKYGHNVRLRRLARQIVATQQPEIKVMQDAVGEEQPPATQSPGQPRANLSPPSAPMDGAVAPGGMKMPQ